MKVVIDTNVFVSSFLGGKPRRIIDYWKTGEITLCLSSEILEEYTRVFEELGFVSEKEYQQLLVLFLEQNNVLFTHSPPNISVVEDDPDDDKFIECAVELEADIIVSGDQDLLAVQNYHEIPIESPRDFLSLIG